MALFVRSSATGDAKLKLTEAALTDDSAGDEVWGGSPLALAATDTACSSFLVSFGIGVDGVDGDGPPLTADAAACSVLFFS